MSLNDIHNAISLRVQGDGHSHSGSPGGPMIEGSGQGVAPANLSARQAREKGLLTSGTYGPSSSTLSASVNLQASLENKLRARPLIVGLTLYSMTWSRSVTPSGALRLRQLVKVRPMPVNATTGRHDILPTPSGTSNHGKNHVAGRLDEWGGNSNPFRGTNLGRVHCPAFEYWVMGYPEAWPLAMQPEMPLFRKLRRRL
jgi:hypothetical protein